jgi:cytochrome P450
VVNVNGVSLSQSIASSMVVVLALANHPEVQRKAQVELDAVVGSDRLPTITDRSSLPYVHAIVKELGRWYNAAPLGKSPSLHRLHTYKSTRLGVVHCSTEDDEYEGYFIPKGTMIIPNVWYVASPLDQGRPLTDWRCVNLGR